MSQHTAKYLRAGIRGEGLHVLRGALACCVPFRTSGSLRGLSRDQMVFPDTGRLHSEERARFLHDWDAGAVYVVFSYGTPIAWVMPDGTAHHVGQRFSVTTSRHQSVVRAYLAAEYPFTEQNEVA